MNARDYITAIRSDKGIKGYATAKKSNGAILWVRTVCRRTVKGAFVVRRIGEGNPADWCGAIFIHAKRDRELVESILAGKDLAAYTNPTSRDLGVLHGKNVLRAFDDELAKREADEWNRGCITTTEGS